MNAGIVIPTYNRSELVREAVESALQQTVPATIVVIDDGSTDSTLERLKAFGNRIRIHSQGNSERGAARNRGVDLIPEADLLFFLDADDWIAPDHVEQLAKLAREHPECSLVAASGFETDGDLRPLRRLPGVPGRPITTRAFLMGNEPLAPSLFAVPRKVFETVGGFPEARNVAGSEDWLFAARALALGPAIRGTRSTVKMRKHDGNSMANARSMHQSMLRAHDHLFGEETSPVLRPDPRLHRSSRANLLLRAAVGYYAAGDMATSRQVLVQAVRLTPIILSHPLTVWTFLRTLLGSRLSARLRDLKHRWQTYS